MPKPIICASSVLLGLALFLPACNHDQTDDAVAAGEKPRHAVQGEGLRETMRELAKHAGSSPVDKLPADPESEKNVDPAVFEEAEKLASQLAKTAETIPAAKRDRALSEPARADFEKLAADLSRRAADFGAAAKEQNVEQMQRSFNAIHSSCIACHSRFFDIAGDLDFPRTAPTPGESTR